MAASVLCGLLAACASSSDDEGRKCGELRDHIVDVRLAASKGGVDGAGAPIDLEKHRSALKQALGSDFVEQCRKDMSPSKIKCALAATDGASASACLSSSATK